MEHEEAGEYGVGEVVVVVVEREGATSVVAVVRPKIFHPARIVLYKPCIIIKK